ncbi:MAG: hypothetical protein L3K17_09960, partial [Thermoplasmata archaeon]|nr:hypothetical protein [Thermoplasmata archaeon]
SSRGNVTVQGVPANVTVAFVANASTEYALRFRDAGLPANDAWTIRIANESNSTLGPSLQFLLANGTYEFFANATGYSATPSQGPITINGSASVANSILVSFALTHAPPPPKFALVFEVGGLPTETVWGVAIAGNTSTTRNASLSVSEPNGSYSLRILGVPGYEWVSGIAADRITWSGSIAVAGASRTFDLLFTPFAWSIQFHETGLPDGTGWNVTWDTPAPPGADAAPTNDSTSGSYGTGAPNGTFAFVVSGVPGFVTPPSGTVTVHGAPLLVNVSFVRVPGSSTLFGTAPVVVFAAIGGAVAVVALLAVALLIRRRGGRSQNTTGPDSDLESAETAPLADSEEPADAGRSG